MQLLLSYGAHPTIGDGIGTTVLSLACHRGLLEKVKLMLAKDKNLDYADERAIIAVHQACKGNIRPLKSPFPSDPE